MGYRLTVCTKKPEYGSSGFGGVSNFEMFASECATLACDGDVDEALSNLYFDEYSDMMEIQVDLMQKMIDYLKSLPDGKNDIVASYDNHAIAEILETFLEEADKSYDWVRLEWM